jgi:hypothetical protein
MRASSDRHFRHQQISIRRAVGAFILASSTFAAPTLPASADPAARPESVAAAHPDGSNHAKRLLLFTRQICADDADRCWELVVSDAHENHAHVVAGPYPRNVWDDHFIANWAPDARSLIFMADLGSGQAIWRVRTDGTHLHKVFTPPDDGNGLDDGPAGTVALTGWVYGRLAG